MSSLILTVISIVLLSAVVVISINYLPAWTKEQADVVPVVRDGARELERAFQLYAKAHGDVPAAVIGGDYDGGASANFAPFLGFMPAAMPGYRWVYGNAGSGASGAYQNAYYFCLTPQSGGLASEGKVRGAQRAQQYLSEEQAFVAPGCGATSNYGYSSYPANMSVTYFVKYVPGQL
jgi:hypothetical protein